MKTCVHHTGTGRGRKGGRPREVIPPERLPRDASLARRAVADPRTLTPAAVLDLQRQSGNAAVADLLVSRAPAGGRGGGTVRGATTNVTGMPDALKAGAEQLSGVRLDDVRVRYDSPEPARLQALAYAHGTDIHLAPGQERQLGHELWHVVQQRQGRVSATGHVGGTAVNDDVRLEHEADAMGRRAHEVGPLHPAEQPAEGRLAAASPPVAQLAKKPEVTHETKFAAPDGSPDSRRRVGVGEQVTFQGDKVGNWTATQGTAPVRDSDTFTWTAPNRGGSATVRLTADGRTTAVRMKVVEPTRITGRKNSDTSIAAGTAGAGMTLTFHYHPKSVSFGNVEAGEVSGPATRIWGYYKEHYADADLWHDSGDHFTAIGEDNEDTAEDTAETVDSHTPYKKGGFRWVIPNRFRVSGEGGDGKVFTHVTQAFRMLNRSGTVRVTKAGARVERTP